MIKNDNDADIDLFVEGVLDQFDKLAAKSECPHGVGDDFICDICEGLAPSADVIPIKPFKMTFKTSDDQ